MRKKAGRFNGTPGLFVSGIELSGAQQQEAFSRIIDDELARKKRSAASVSIGVTQVKP